MRCVMCHRPMTVAAVSVPTRNGPLGYGPKCAKSAGLLAPVKRKVAQVVVRQRAAVVDPDQMELLEVMA